MIMSDPIRKQHSCPGEYENTPLAETIERIRRMEYYFDTLCAAVASEPHLLKDDGSVQAMLLSLMTYYENGQWLLDYEADERGLLPPWLKRGVLSEDGVYHLLSEIEKDGSP